MHPDLKLAVELQAVDKEIARLSAEVAYLPRHIQDIENKLAGALAQLEADRKALADNQKERRRLDGETSMIQQKISKYKGQIFDVKTNEQYKALQHEIEFAEAEVRKIEDRILEHMVSAEEIEGRIKKAEKQLASERVAVEKEKAEATARTRLDEDRLKVLNGERDQHRKQMTADVLREYDRLFGGRKGQAISEVRDGTCSECNVRLRPQALQEVKSSERIRQCESCGRMLVYVPPPVAENAEPSEPQAAAPPA